MQKSFYLETKQNPSDLGTKFTSFEDSYLKMTDTSTFRTGPASMKDGLDKAKINKNIINISDLAVDQQSKNVATAQLTEFDQGEPRSYDAVTSVELALLTAIGEISLYQTNHVQEDTIQPLSITRPREC